MTEAEKIIGDQFKIQIVSSGVGPLSEKDLNEAHHTGAIIIGFDINVAPNVQNRIEGAGVTVRLHKLIYKFQDDLEDLVHDMKQKDAKKGEDGRQLEIFGEAHVAQIFKVTDQGPKKGSPKRMIQVAGSRVHDGQLSMHHKYRIIRNDMVILEDLQPHSIKRFKKDVGKVEKGMECGIAFEGLKAGFSIE